MERCPAALIERGIAPRATRLLPRTWTKHVWKGTRESATHVYDSRTASCTSGVSSAQILIVLSMPDDAKQLPSMWKSCGHHGHERSVARHSHDCQCRIARHSHDCQCLTALSASSL